MSDIREPPLKVLFIAGVSHCGSTILGTILGQLDGFFFAGELAHTARSLERDRLCGCGEPLRRCPCWERIFVAAQPLAVEDLRLRHRHERARAAYAHGLRARGLLRSTPDLERARRAYSAALCGIRRATGCRVVVDGSKSPAYGRLLQSLDDVDLHVVHIVRDPRATAWSWERTPPMPPTRPAQLAVIWDVWNTSIELLWSRRRERYLRIRYEDFAAQPEAWVRRIIDLAGEKPTGLPFVSGREVVLKATHDVEGHPHRHELRGRVDIRANDNWRSPGAVRQRRSLAALTWPLRVRYGYRG